MPGGKAKRPLLPEGILGSKSASADEVGGNKSEKSTRSSGGLREKWRTSFSTSGDTKMNIKTTHALTADLATKTGTFYPISPAYKCVPGL